MAKENTGIILIVLGFSGLVLGLILSATVLGAVCGIPIVIAALPVIIYGYVQHHKWKMAKLAESVKEGIREGLSDQEKKS
jgi:hypothetical protein